MDGTIEARTAASEIMTFSLPLCSDVTATTGDVRLRSSWYVRSGWRILQDTWPLLPRCRRACSRTSRSIGSFESRGKRSSRSRAGPIQLESSNVGKMVRELATKYGLPFELAELKLGPDTTETEARRARYAWLRD